MKREWKPGDVALVNDCTRPEAPWKPAVCTAARTPERETVWRLLGSGGEVWGSVSQARPLVVIDPEDREQAERLHQSILRVYRQQKVTDAADNTTLTQAALREFANPTPPKPEEPMGLGAVVEDSHGSLWFRMTLENQTWPGEVWQEQYNNADRWSQWQDIAVARILSEGVTA